MIGDSIASLTTKVSANTVNDTLLFNDLKEKLNTYYLSIKLNDKNINEILFSYMEYIHKKNANI